MKLHDVFSITAFIAKYGKIMFFFVVVLSSGLVCQSESCTSSKSDAINEQ